MEIRSEVETLAAIERKNMFLLILFISNADQFKTGPMLKYNKYCLQTQNDVHHDIGCI